MSSGPVVGDLVGRLVGRRVAGRAGDGADVEAVAAVAVVGLPGRVGRRHEHLRVARVVAHDEHDLAVAAGVVAHQVGDVDARDRRARNGPRTRDRPVAAVDQAGGRVGAAGGLGRRTGRRQVRGDQTRAIAAVVPQAQDVDVVVRGRRLDLERDRLALVHALRRRVALDRGIAVAVDLPVGRVLAGLRVLAGHRVRHGRRARRRVGRRRRPCKSDDREHDHRQAHPEPSYPSPAAVVFGQDRLLRGIHTSEQRIERGGTPAGLGGIEDEIRGRANFGASPVRALLSVVQAS